MSMMNRLWYKQHRISLLLLPFSWAYGMIAWVRRIYLQQLKQTRFHVPIIVVGNLTVGGVGKTPLVIALAKAFQEKGLRVGIVSRGYGGRGPFPREVGLNDKPSDVGDEPLLLCQKTRCPVVIAPKRVSAVQYLLRHYQPQVILSDDGLQHYAMGRAIEIAVIDGIRGLGNERMFPAGPLRERESRLKSVDFIVVNAGVHCSDISTEPRNVSDVIAVTAAGWKDAYRMNMVAGEITALVSGAVVKPADLTTSVAAVAAIGHPARFYQTLDALGVPYQAYAFADHYAFRPEDLIFKETTIVMTEKDAVKCASIATDNMLVLPVTAQLEHTFWDALWAHKQLKEVLAT